MIKSKTCFTLWCDGCDSAWEYGDYIPHFDDEGEAPDLARDDSGWIVTRDDKHYCYACWLADKTPKCLCPDEGANGCSDSDCVPGCPCELHPRVEPDGPCPKCGEVFERQTQLGWHKYTKHPKVEVTQ